MSAPRYALALSMAGKRAVVVGGGRVALRRARGLLDADANVIVIAPAVLTRAGRAAGHRAAPRVPRRRPRRGVARTRRQQRPGGQRSGGRRGRAAPDLVRAGGRRRRVGGVDAVGHPARTTSRSRSPPAAIRAGPSGCARRSGPRSRPGTLPVRRQRPAATGLSPWWAAVPATPGLITVLGRRLLAEADVVVTDKLAPRALLAALDPDVEIIDAGKAPHAHNLTQDKINELIVARALAGQRVVRLKGGDPFVFGRGGEEALACVRAGVPFQVVPGVTSAIAVPAYAGIPVTHRGVTQDFAVVSAHLDPSQPGATVDWDALATRPRHAGAADGRLAPGQRRGRADQARPGRGHAGGRDLRWHDAHPARPHLDAGRGGGRRRAGRDRPAGRGRDRRRRPACGSR